MGLDASLHLIYGFKTDRKITEKLEEAYNNETITGEQYDNIYEELTNNTEYGKLFLCEDTMCGNYEYIGLSLLYKYDDYGEDIHKQLDIKEISKQCDDELLDKLMQEFTILGDLYDIAGLFDGELPQLYFVKKVW